MPDFSGLHGWNLYPNCICRRCQGECLTTAGVFLIAIDVERSLDVIDDMLVHVENQRLKGHETAVHNEA